MNDQILDYLHGALDDSGRSKFELRMREDATLRNQVATMRRLQQHISENVRGNINAIEPPSTMTFAAIAPRLRQRISLRQRMGYTFAAFAAVLILFFAVAYSLPVETRQPIEGGVTTPIPTVNLLTISTITPLTLTLTTNAVNAPSIPIRTPTPSSESLLESPTVASGNSLITRTPLATEKGNR
jgi:uncharacterized membrane protein